jgi:hypothetical protein
VELLEPVERVGDQEVPHLRVAEVVVEAKERLAVGVEARDLGIGQRSQAQEEENARQEVGCMGRLIPESPQKAPGTWAGATEALTAGWCPLFVRSGKDVGAGNQELIKKGGRAVSDTDLNEADDIIGWMTKNYRRARTRCSVVRRCTRR